MIHPRKLLQRVFLAIAIVVIVAGLPAASRADSPLNTDVPVEFFTTLADRFLQSQMGISVTNIPVFTNNTFVYSPAVHRLLQLAANIYDSTTNRAFSDAAPGDPPFPSVFRPTFTRRGNDVFITGFVEEGENSTGYLAIPLSLPAQLNLVGPATTNIYGVPYIIGARKGYPNFNEFAFQSIFQIIRKMQLTKPFLGAPRSTWITNVAYVIGISNVAAVEAWNSYSNTYPRAIDMIAADHFISTLYVTNLGVGTLLSSNNLILGDRPQIMGNSWLGYPVPGLGSGSVATNSFKLGFMTNTLIVPDSYVHRKPPGLQTVVGTNSVFETPADFSVPQFILSVSNRLRFVMRDATTGRLIDYVQLDGFDSTRDLGAQMPLYDKLGVWDTNRISSQPFPYVPTYGALRQMLISIGSIALSISDWNGEQTVTYTQSAKQAAISAFSDFYNNLKTNLAMVCPFSPSVRFSEYWSFEANDPMVHQLKSHLGAFPPPVVASTVYPLNRGVSNILANIYVVNTRYQPWGGNPKKANSQFDYNLAVKDSLIGRADDWSLPVGMSPGASLLGKVHRGTPWQTVYLKSAAVDHAAWQNWSGDADAASAGLSEPTNDWKLASVFAGLVNTNRLGALFSPNQISLGIFEEPITVVTNTSGGAELDTYPPISPVFLEQTMDANSPQSAVIVSAITEARDNRANHRFDEPSDILGIPLLGTQSPWLNVDSINQQYYGISDEAYEAIPAQLLGRLRPDSIGSQSVNSEGFLEVRFTGLDGYAYDVQSSTNLVDWTVVASLSPTNGAFKFIQPAMGERRRYFRSVVQQ